MHKKQKDSKPKEDDPSESPFESTQHSKLVPPSKHYRDLQQDS